MTELKLRVWWNRNGKQTNFSVKDVEQAKQVIERETQKDLKNPFVVWNAFGLEVFEDGDWCEFYNEDGLDILEIINQDKGIES